MRDQAGEVATAASLIADLIRPCREDTLLCQVRGAIDQISGVLLFDIAGSRFSGDACKRFAPRVKQPDPRHGDLAAKTDRDVRRGCRRRGSDKSPYRWPCLPRADNRVVAVMDRAGRKRPSARRFPDLGGED